MAINTAPPPADTTAAPLPKELKRNDGWWIGALWFFMLFSAFGIWVTWRAFQNDFYTTEHIMKAGLPNYLSPMYEPTFMLPVSLNLHLLWFHITRISPALLILPFPLVFRLSCYYYRKSVYRSYLADPLGCGVPEPGFLAKWRFKKYTGERTLPLIIMNIHRYTFYTAVVFIFLLWGDTIRAWFQHTNAQGEMVWGFNGIHLGAILFLVNIVLLTTYTFSCHSWRHLVGGGDNCYSCDHKVTSRYAFWKRISFLNENHGRWAMASLITVGLCDFFVWGYTVLISHGTYISWL